VGSSCLRLPRALADGGGASGGAVMLPLLVSELEEDEELFLPSLACLHLRFDRCSCFGLLELLYARSSNPTVHLMLLPPPHCLQPSPHLHAHFLASYASQWTSGAAERLRGRLNCHLRPLGRTGSAASACSLTSALQGRVLTTPPPNTTLRCLERLWTTS
jgi:hypothetical protein